MSLAARAWLSLAVLALAMGLLVFVPAGTLDFWQAWIHLAVFFAAAVLVTRDLVEHDPALLARRLRGGPVAETRPVQRIIMVFASLGFVSLLVVPGFDRRFGWSAVPVAIVAAANALTVIGFAL